MLSLPCDRSVLNDIEGWAYLVLQGQQSDVKQVLRPPSQSALDIIAKCVYEMFCDVQLPLIWWL